MTAPPTGGLTSGYLTFWRGCMTATVLFGAFVGLCGQNQVTAVGSKSDVSEPASNAGRSPQLATVDYVISPDDELDVNVMDVPELSLTYRVSPAGLITVSVLKEPILAAGLTLGRFTQVLSRELQAAGMVENPRITVRVKQSRLNSVAITGAVRKPQIYQIFGNTTLLDVISQAEGLAPNAGESVTVTRGQIGMRAVESGEASEGKLDDKANAKVVTVDVQKLMEEGDASLNLMIYPGDRVTVQRASIVYVVGAVNRAGGFELIHNPQEMTVLKAIALAQSLTPTASAKKAVIIRDDPITPGGKQQIPVRLDEILKGKVPDMPLLAQDVLFVPDSASKRMMQRAGEALWQAAVLSIYTVQ